MEDGGVQQIEVSEDVRNEIDQETKRRYGVLYVAALKGDWDKAEAIYKDYPGDAVASLSDLGDNALHVAAGAGHTPFVAKLISSNYMKEDDLEKKNKKGNTAFTLVAMSGNVQLALLMIEKNKKLAMIRNGIEDNSGMLAVQVAALLGHKEMVNYLYKITREDLKNEDRIELLVKLIDSDLYDVALLMVEEHPDLADSRIKGGETALHALARKPPTLNDYFCYQSNLEASKIFCRNLSVPKVVKTKKMNPEALKLVELLWKVVVKRLDYFEISELIRKPWPLTYSAAKEGNFDFLFVLIREHPELIYRVDEDGYSIFHTAVKYRRENIFHLVYQIPSIKNTIVVSQVGEEKNTILHLAAMLPPDQDRLNDVSGAALQMQRDLWWFKEVRNLMPSSYAELKNKGGKTAGELFTESHTNLMKEGEKWMKKTADSCMLVATLIATVVFAAAFTLPGGIKEDTGTPNFLKKASFTIFVVSDTVSLVSSACSILAFLSILNARYLEDDFRWWLPSKLVLGLFTLFISITAMMVVFCTTLFIVCNEQILWPAVLAVPLASIPVFMFFSHQHGVFYDVLLLVVLYGLQ
ncbi:hypothetical protein ACOSQ2_013511 [Xanthoceras sorbifolium]